MIIVASIIQNAYTWIRYRRFEKMHLFVMFAVLILGGFTLLFDDVRFIKWKPTVVNWIFTVLMLGTQLLTSKTALERVLGSKLEMPQHAWRKLNMSWAIFFAVLGLLNLYVAFIWATPQDPLVGLFGVIEETQRETYWVYFKVVGILGLTLSLIHI